MLRAVAHKVIPASVRRAIWEQWQDSRLRVLIDDWASSRLLRATFLKTQDGMSVRWLGKPMWQYPLDAWLMQEIIGETRPDLVVETGTFRGGSAYFFGCLCDLLDHGRVISIDIDAQDTIAHPRITYLRGSSTDPAIVSRVSEEVRTVKASSILIVLDSDHSAPHVLAELQAYAPMVPVGSYIHVQDGMIDQTGFFRGKGRPGPVVAVRTFLNQTPCFARAEEVERRYIMTAHPYGWLRRVSP
jgi:cephalosporin hydroxylase